MLQQCSFDAVSHLAAAGHTLLACMMREPHLAFEHRPELLSVIDILLVVGNRYPCAENASKLLFQLSRRLDYHPGGAAGGIDAGGVRIMARKPGTSSTVSRSPSSSSPSGSTSPLSESGSTLDWLLRAAEGQTGAGGGGGTAVQGSFPARRQQHILHPPLKVFLFQTFSRFPCREAYPFLHLQVTGVSSTPPLDRVSTPRRSSSSTTAFRFPLNRSSSWLSLILVLKVADLILRASGPPVERASESRTGKI